MQPTTPSGERSVQLIAVPSVGKASLPQCSTAVAKKRRLAMARGYPPRGPRQRVCHCPGFRPRRTVPDHVRSGRPRASNGRACLGAPTPARGPEPLRQHARHAPHRCYRLPPTAHVACRWRVYVRATKRPWPRGPSSHRCSAAGRSSPRKYWASERSGLRGALLWARAGVWKTAGRIVRCALRPLVALVFPLFRLASCAGGSFHGVPLCDHLYKGVRRVFFRLLSLCQHALKSVKLPGSAALRIVWCSRWINA